MYAMLSIIEFTHRHWVSIVCLIIALVMGAIFLRTFKKTDHG